MELARYSVSRKGVGGRPSNPTAVIRVPQSIAAFTRHMKAGTLKAGDLNAFLDIAPGERVAVPMASATASCGFPSPADDYLDSPLDFNELIIHNLAATFAIRLSSDSMTGAGLFPGDIAVIDRSITPANGCIVLALLDGEFTVKRYYRRAQDILLHAENPAFSDIVVSEERSFEIWGVMVKAIRMLTP